jgi:hypothetical protein
MLSHGELREQLGKQLRSSLGEGWWTLDVWDTHAIVEDQAGALYRQDYRALDSTCELVGGLQRVQRVVDYLPIAESLGPLREAVDTEGSRWEVVLIAPGLSANGVMYTADMLRQAAPLFEGVRALARSDAEHRSEQAVHVRNVVGWYEQAQYREGVGVVATFCITEDADWLKSKLRSAWEGGKKDLIGFSLVAAGRGHRVQQGQQMITWVDALESVHYVDVVVNPAAGGRVLQLVAATPIGRALHYVEREEGMREQLLESLKKTRPHMYKLIDPATITDEHLGQLVAEGLAQQNGQAPLPVPVTVAASTAGQPQPMTLTVYPVGQGPVVSAPLPVASTDNRQPTPGNGGPVGAEDANRRVDVIECRWTLREALDGSNLPVPVRTKLQTQFGGRLERGDVWQAQELQEAITAERQTLAALTESGMVRGFGQEGQVDVTEGADDKTVQHLIDFFDGKVHSFKEAYIQLTGDSKVTVRSLSKPVALRNWQQVAESKGIVLRESLDSTSFDAVLADVMHKRFLDTYMRPGLQIWRRVVIIGSFNDLKTQHRTRFGGYGNLPIVAERAPYTALTSPTDEEATYVPAKRGGTEDLSWEMILNDDANAIRFIPIRLGVAAGQTLLEFVLDLIATNPTIYDSVALFHANHNNLSTTAFGSTTAQYMAMRLRMRQQTELDSGKRLGLTPSILLLPGDLEEAAFNAFQRGTEQEPKFATTVTPTILPIDYWSDTNNYFALAEPTVAPVLEVAFLNGEDEPELQLQEDPSQGQMFARDVRTYRIKHTYGGAVLDFRGAQGAIVA